MNRLSIAGLLSAAAVLAAVGTFQAFAGDVQGYILKPAYRDIVQMEVIRLDTQEINGTVDNIKARIKGLEDHLSSDSEMSKPTRIFLETQLESERKLLIQKGDMLHQSQLNGLDMLTLLQAKAL